MASGHQQETHGNHLGRWQHHGHVCQHPVAHAGWNSDSGAVLGRWGVGLPGPGQIGQALLGKILDDEILMRLDPMDIVLFEQKLSSPCPGKWLERDVPPMLRCEFVRC